MSGSLGFLVIGGHRFPVSSVSLARGRIVVRAYAWGPLPALAGPVTVFGSDGVGVWQGQWLELPAISAGDVFDVVYDAVVETVNPRDRVRIGNIRE